MSPPPTIVAWSTPADLDNGFVPTTSYNGPDIICHKLATSGGVEAPIKAGAKLEFQWTPWPTSTTVKSSTTWLTATDLARLSTRPL